MTTESVSDVEQHEFHDAQEEHDEFRACARDEDEFASPQHSARSSEARASQSADEEASCSAESSTSDVVVRETSSSDRDEHEDNPAEHHGKEVCTNASDEGDDHEHDEERLANAEALKQAGNSFYKEGKYSEALEQYTAALDKAPTAAKERAVYLANSAACHLAAKNFAECVRCCNEALAIDPTYSKAIHRRMAANEALDRLDSALEDAKQALALDPGNTTLQSKIRTWEPIVKERQEKMKEEVLGKLKDLGNNILGRFGMSVDNFKMVQDPNTGSYSINFQR